MWDKMLLNLVFVHIWHRKCLLINHAYMISVKRKSTDGEYGLPSWVISGLAANARQFPCTQN